MINKGLSDLSCNGEKYEKAKPLFHAILYGLIHLVIKMLKPTLEKHFSSK